MTEGSKKIYSFVGIILAIFAVSAIFSWPTNLALASDATSTTYKIINYGFGSGDQMNSTNFTVSGSLSGPLVGTWYSNSVPLVPGAIFSCGKITQPGTYTLSTNLTGISGSCFTVLANNVTIDGSGYTITATSSNQSYAVVAISSISNGGSGYGPTTIQNLNLIGFGGGVIDASGNNATSGNTNGGAGGSIIVSNSTIGTTTSNGANGFGSSSGGSGGSIVITSSGTLDISSKTFSVFGGSGSLGGGAPGNLTLNYTTGLTTNNLTLFSSITQLSRNLTQYGTYLVASGTAPEIVNISGTNYRIYNPTTFYFHSILNDGNWDNQSNWWTDSNFSVQATRIPNTSDDVIVDGDITTGAPSANSIIFNGASTNSTNITAISGVTFNDSSTNTGTITTATTTFYGNNSSASFNGIGTIIGIIQRIFTLNVSTSRDFTTEGNNSNWILIAQGAIVDISNAIYNTATNLFYTLANGNFFVGSNPGGQVVPQIVIASTTIAYTGAENTKTIKWQPSIDWDTSVTCKYSYDNWATSNLTACSHNDTTLPRPTFGAHNLYLRGIDSHGDIAEKTIIYFYDNTAPIWTACGDDVLDEPTRAFYYLQSDITNDCRILADNIELRGSYASSDFLGYKVDGNIIANATTTGAKGFNLTLKNIIVTGTTTANGADGAPGIDGGHGGNIYVATSSTGAIVSVGGDPLQQNGGNGGIVEVHNSYAIEENTSIIARGGDSAGCGYGGNGGDVNLINSSKYVILNEEGQSALEGCTPIGSHPTGGQQIIVGAYTAPGSGNSSSANSSRHTSAVGGSSILNGRYDPLNQKLIISIKKLTPLKFGVLPTFGGTGKGSFSFIDAINNLLFNLQTITVPPSLKTFLSENKIGSDQSLANLNVTPRLLPDTLSGVYSIKIGKNKIKSYISYDPKNKLFQLVSAKVNSKLTITLKGETSGTWNGKDVEFINDSVNITLPNKPGRYYFNSPKSAVPLIIDAKLAQNNQDKNVSRLNSIKPIVNIINNTVNKAFNNLVNQIKGWIISVF